MSEEGRCEWNHGIMENGFWFFGLYYHFLSIFVMDKQDLSFWGKVMLIYLDLVNVLMFYFSLFMPSWHCFPFPLSSCLKNKRIFG